MTHDGGSAGAGRDGRLQELVKQWRARAENDARDDGTAAEFADELAAILAIPDPLASSSEPQVTFSTTTVDGPSTAAPGMPTIGGSSVPVRASGEPQK